MLPVPTPHEDDDTALLVADAARRANRSEAWVRTWRASGPLEAVEIDGRQAVTLRSLRAFLAQRSRRPRSVLRLVIDNTRP